MKEIKELNEWRDIPCSWKKTQIIKIPILTNLIYIALIQCNRSQYRGKLSFG